MGWFVVTIIIPLVAPIILMAIYRTTAPLPRRSSGKTKLIVPIKDGQFCWVGMAFCTSGMYEIADAHGPAGQSLSSFPGQWWAIGGLVAALIGCSFIAAGGAVFSTPLRRPSDKPWHRHYSTLVWSGIATTVAAARRTRSEGRKNLGTKKNGAGRKAGISSSLMVTP
jgi:hypothetical protein